MKSPVVARILAKEIVTQRVRASVAFADDDASVERPTPGAAPTAFRIWTSGENPTSKGTHDFSRRSAELLLADQAVRGNLYSIDVDHMSLSDAAPPEHHRAVGWHRIAVRETASGPELWAVDVEWTPEVRAALESTPPGFRYFSPAYDVSKKTGEIVAYLNTALTNNPATYQVTALATRASQKEEPMTTMKDVLAALKAMAEGDDDEAKSAARMMKAAEGDEKKPDEEEKKDTKAAEGDEKKPDEEEKKDTKAGEGSDEKKCDEEEKKDVAATLSASAVEKLVDDKLRAIAELGERDRLIASRKDVGEKVLTALKSKPLALVREMLDAIPVAAKRNPAGDASIRATRGAGAGDERAPQLDPTAKADLDERMGIAPKRASIRREGNAVVFGVMTADDARQRIAAKGGK